MGKNSRDRRHKPKPVHVPPELFKLVSPDRSARITHCRLRLTIGLARTEGRQRSNSAHRARRRIDAFTATEDRLPPLDSIAHPPGARPGINKSQTVWLGDRMKTLSPENSTTVPQERLPAGCASFAKASIRSRSPSSSRETFTMTSVGR